VALRSNNVDVDLHKLDAYNVTIPQVIAALSNSNINVGGREITIGYQSVNIRGIGLFDSGGNDDLTKAGTSMASSVSFLPPSMVYLSKSRT
jgi:Cu/Ag efflux pump CusA